MLKKLMFRPGANREATRYAAETIGFSTLPGGDTVGSWYETDKVRFRSGSAEKIGGWRRISANKFLGVCRSLFNWTTLAGSNLLGLGTNIKFYIEDGGTYHDVTPLRLTATITEPFIATAGSTTLTVTHVAHKARTGDYVTFKGATSLGGSVTDTVLNREYTLTVLTPDTYTVTLTEPATALDTGTGGTVTAEYQLNTGLAVNSPAFGWGAGGWGTGGWGTRVSTDKLRSWNQYNFGEDLLIGYEGSPIYLWDATNGYDTRAVALYDLPGASDAPITHKALVVSDVSRFVIAFGCNELGQNTPDPLLIRWSEQESAVDWTHSATNQAGGIRLSQGSTIVAATQSRQEILVWTDAALYAMQYVGPPAVWSTQLLGANTSIVSTKSVAVASGVAYWMGVDKFYKYDGRVQTLRCDLRQHVFGDLNHSQIQQVFCGTNEGFNEVWWFYPSAGSTQVDKYVVYNYAEDIWYYGTMGRTAWIDSGLRQTPEAATYSGVIVSHETGVDDNETEVTKPIRAYVASTEFDIDDGHNFGFVWRLLPDITFRGSEMPGGQNPNVTFTLTPLRNSGSGYTNPGSVAGSDNAQVQRSAVVPVEEFTGQVNIRVRGRQLTLKVESNQIGCTWQLGAPRIDIRPDGRR